MLQNNLIAVAARKYGIKRGNNEPSDQWKNRVFYSVLGQMGYASLWDVEENGEPISVIHFKTRIKKIYTSYCAIFHDLQYGFRRGISEEDLATQILNTYRNAGFIYHSPYQIVAAKFSAAQLDDILFLRGLAPGDQQLISGLGTYQLIEQNDLQNGSVNEMFQLPSKSLLKMWDELQCRARWSIYKRKGREEFLRAMPVFSKDDGWQDQFPTDQGITLLKLGEKGNELYYLYKEVDHQCYVSQLPIWLMMGTGYFRVENELLASLGRLPAITYKEDGDIVTFKLKSRLPDEEWNFLRVYSWPVQYARATYVIVKSVFYAIKKTLEPIGYQFVKE